MQPTALISVKKNSVIATAMFGESLSLLLPFLFPSFIYFTCITFTITPKVHFPISFSLLLFYILHPTFPVLSFPLFFLFQFKHVLFSPFFMFIGCPCPWDGTNKIQL